MRGVRSNQRVVAGTALGVAAVLASILGVGTVRAATAFSIASVVLVACATVLSSSEFRHNHPVAARAAISLLAVDVSIVLTAFFSATVDDNLAIGAAMSIVLLGLSFLTGSSGQISLGNGAFMGVGAFTVAVWANHHPTTPIAVVLILAVVAGALVGLLLGLPATRLRGPYLAGMTLAFSVAFGAVLNLFGTWTGGDSGLQLPTAVNAPAWVLHFFKAGTSSLTTNSVWLVDITIVTAGIALFFMANLFASRTGRAMRLVRDNDVAAELVGISLPRARVIAFIVSASYAALGGGLWTLINNAVTPSTYGFALSVTILSLVVIGGIGTIPGALIGGLIYAFAANVIAWFTAHTGLNPQGNVASQLNGIIFGGLLVLTILFAPTGIAGFVRRRFAAWRAR
ncbi:MAG: branched-chain amino acid ABC transporter permease [Actinomycetales bacterium]|nr:branched-chain amino acid ABC transporter permease [Actinomycetales bacterium]